MSGTVGGSTGERYLSTPLAAEARTKLGEIRSPIESKDLGLVAEDAQRIAQK